MTKVVDFESRRHPAEHKRKEARANDLREAFTAARKEAETQSDAAAKVLKLFKPKTPKKP